MVFEESGLNQLLSQYASDIGQEVASPLGGGGGTPLISATPILLSRLQKRQESARFIIVIAVILLCFLFFAGIALIAYHRNSPQIVSILFGGNFFSLLIVVYWLRRLWLEKTAIDTLLIIISGMTPIEAAKTLMKFHFASINTKNRTSLLGRDVKTNKSKP